MAASTTLQGSTTTMAAGQLSRRKVLAGLAAAAGLGGLPACSSSGGASSNNASANSAVTLPSYLPYTGVKPDLPGTEAGVDPAFRTFPEDKPVSVPEKPGKGEQVTGLANIYYAVPPGPSKNSYWAGLNERLGVDLKLQMVNAADYATKYATVVAGDELPDMLQMRTVTNFPQLLDKRFAALDEHLSGDAVKDYPNLANLPTLAWRSAIFNGRLYGVPIPRGATSNYIFVRQDIIEERGLPAQPKGYDELIALAKGLTDSKKRRWAFATAGQPRKIFAVMNGEPNSWREEGGKLTHQFETEEYKQTITDLVALWKSGVIHPDAFSDAQPAKNLFNSGTTAISPDGYLGWTQYIADNKSNPDFKLGLMRTYTRDGSELGHWHLGGGVYSITSLKKQDKPERIKLLLRVLNWLAAPFGTEEYLYRLFGKEGTDHTVSAGGDPELTKTGQTNTVLPIRYLADSPSVVYQPGRPKDADLQHAYQTELIATGIQNPTVGLWSNTAATKGPAADTAHDDAVNEIIKGRKPISELDSLLSTWKSTVGDAMRKEYQDQLQKTGGK